MSELKDLIAERDELNKAIREEGKKEFGAMIAGLFEKYPYLQNFGWWNVTYDRFMDGTNPGLSMLAVNIDTSQDHWYLDPVYSWRGSEKDSPRLELQEAVRKELVLFDEIVLELFPDEGVLVFPDRVETFYVSE